MSYFDLEQCNTGRAVFTSDVLDPRLVEEGAIYADENAGGVGWGSFHFEAEGQRPYFILTCPMFPLIYQMVIISSLIVLVGITLVHKLGKDRQLSTTNDKASNTGACSCRFRTISSLWQGAPF